jgi:hypothetical protein
VYWTHRKKVTPMPPLIASAQRRMAANMRASAHRDGPFQVSAKQHQPVHVVIVEGASRSPSGFDLPSGDYTGGRLKPHFPKHEPRRDCVALHDQWMWRELCNKRTVLHRGQR